VWKITTACCPETVKMGRKLFVGCSHSYGYIQPEFTDRPQNIWRENNYAEIYFKTNNQSTVIYASAGTGNRSYPVFLADAFSKYNDIDEVFVQSTYWGRFPIAINPSLDETEVKPLDFFLRKNNEDTEKLHRYDILLSPDYIHHENFIKPEAEDYDRMPYIRDTIPWQSEPDVRRNSYMYIQMYHYNQTHLEQHDYFKDMLVCDTLCRNNDAKMRLWNINNKCYIPKETANYFTDLQVTTIADKSARMYLLDKLNIDIDEHKVDSEHYNEYAHSLISEHYIPYLREQT